MRLSYMLEDSASIITKSLTETIPQPRNLENLSFLDRTHTTHLLSLTLQLNHLPFQTGYKPSKTKLSNASKKFTITSTTSAKTRSNSLKGTG